MKKERLLGKGRYSEKWVVSWKDEKIVMKTFSTLEEDQWLRETKVYLSGLCHENVLSTVSILDLEIFSVQMLQTQLTNSRFHLQVLSLPIF